MSIEFLHGINNRDRLENRVTSTVRELLRSKSSLTVLMGHTSRGRLAHARCLRQSEFDVSQILTVLGGGCP